jgi:hypothetical protein
MDFDCLPLVVKDRVFKIYISTLDSNNFFEQLIKLRSVNKEFKQRVNKILKNLFTLKKPYVFKKIKSKEDIKSVFLRDRLSKYLENNYTIIFLDCDFEKRLLCSNCQSVLVEECYFTSSQERVDDWIYGKHRYIKTENVCWDCYNTLNGGKMYSYLKLEDNHPVCQKVDDFISKIIN